MATKKTEKEIFFKYLNPNPTAKFKKNGEPFRWTKPDCVIRAFTIATGKSWVESYDILCEIGRKNFDVPNSRDVLEEALLNEGFKKCSCKVGKGESRPKVNDMAKSSSGKIMVLNIANHDVCAKDGFFYDTWDCGEYSVYTYWVKDN